MVLWQCRQVRRVALLSVVLAAVSILPAAGRGSYQESIIELTRDLRCPENEYAGYGGPSMDSYFYKYFQEQRLDLQLIYLPVFWTNCISRPDRTDTEKYLMGAQQLLDGLDRSLTYFTLMQHDDGFVRIDIPSDLRLVVFDSGGAIAVDHLYDLNIIAIPIPLLKEELQPSFVGKTRLGTFVGTLGTEHHGTNTRPRLAALYNRTFEFSGHRDDWPAFMESGHFSLAPRGYGATSFRLYEALQLGSIPIYVWDRSYWLPYQELIDWNEIAIVVARPFIKSIDRMVRDAPVAAMQQKISQVRHMFTYQYTAEYIARVVIEADLF